jgi:1-deoxy-D-xylulose-5-phosphate reductoisomerase
MKKIVILGATGSIGTQTLDIVRRLPDRLRVIGLSAHRNVELLREQAQEFGIPDTHIAQGDEDLTRLAVLPDAGLVIVAVAGAVGTQATLAALHAGKDVALATKEVMVAAGELVTEAALASGSRILPVDSEHSAIFQCLQGSPSNSVAKLWLTASGGPFREWSIERMAQATVAEASNHPTWPTMGRKITIDSATLMNKALEIIEARWLFDVPTEKIGVVIHPQSVVHSLVEFADSAVLAQLGLPDMRLPIEYALLHPERLDAGLPRLDLMHMTAPLTFEPPDEARFPSLGLGRRASAAGGTMPAVLNAANETAVSLFLEERITFPGMASLVERVMDAHQPEPQSALADILRADTWARQAARQFSEYSP